MTKKNFFIVIMTIILIILFGSISRYLIEKDKAAVEKQRTEEKKEYDEQKNEILKKNNLIIKSLKEFDIEKLKEKEEQSLKIDDIKS